MKSKIFIIALVLLGACKVKTQPPIETKTSLQGPGWHLVVVPGHRAFNTKQFSFSEGCITLTDEEGLNHRVCGDYVISQLKEVR